MGKLETQQGSKTSKRDPRSVVMFGKWGSKADSQLTERKVSKVLIN